MYQMHGSEVVTPDLLLRAYSVGLFPMARGPDCDEIEWYFPDRRGILPLSDIHISRSLRKLIRKGVFEIRVDTDFAGVISYCARLGEVDGGSWINRRLIDLYTCLYARGFCHSVECYHNDRLVGGLYGVHLGGAFFGESMFSHVSNASKIALVYLVARLLSGGFCLLDTQFMTPHLRSLGGREISRERYSAFLREALSVDGDFHKFCSEEERSSVLHLISQTS